ncbi:MAG: glyoxalase/bleomycin resistance/extradiol dioxygenase family protein [Filomicrobium sp.]|nr:glyoxalase/bleomycin resistance/extradiol dioxygenase family protein [Filomicrobium sp.]
MAKPVIEDAVAIVPVRHITRTMDFYADVLGFERRSVSEDNSFAIAVHGPAAIHFVSCDDDEALGATANNISIYLWVREVDELFGSLKPKLDMLPEGRVRPPFDQPYGMWEFHVKDPDGCLLFFGENCTED